MATASCLAATGRLTRGCGSNISVLCSLSCLGYLIATPCRRWSRLCGPGRNEITKLGQCRVRQTWTVAQTPLRCFRCRHPQWKVIPLPIGIGDNDNRFAAMRPVFQRRGPGSSERMETVMDRDRLVHLVGFVCGSTRQHGTLTSRRSQLRFRPRGSRRILRQTWRRRQASALPHDLPHTFASHALTGTENHPTTRRVVLHPKLQETEDYTHPDRHYVPEAAVGMSETIAVDALTGYPWQVDAPLRAVRHEGDADECLSLNQSLRQWPS